MKLLCWTKIKNDVVIHDILHNQRTDTMKKYLLLQKSRHS